MALGFPPFSCRPLRDARGESTMTEPTPPELLLGPAPFRFDLPHGPLRAAAFGPVFRALAWALLVVLAVWMWRLQLPWRHPATTWGLLAWAMMAYTVWHIQRSQLTLSAEALEQGWMWRRQMPLQDLAYARIIRLPGFDWLVAPRLYVRNLTGRFVVFYCSDPAVLAELRRLSQELAEFRRMR